MYNALTMPLLYTSRLNVYMTLQWLYYVRSYDLSCHDIVEIAVNNL